MPNPSGANQFANQPAYGDVKKLQSLTSAAPLAGTSKPAPQNAPKRAQRAATHGRRGSAAPAPAAMAPPAAMDQTSYKAQLRSIYQELVSQYPDYPIFQEQLQQLG